MASEYREGTAHMCVQLLLSSRAHKSMRFLVLT